jgi:hypothetical protein
MFKNSFVILLSVITSFGITLSTVAATVVGTLNDISLNALNTKLLFTPTNEVLVNAAGLSAGGVKVIESTAGAFSVPLDTGDYTVSLPLIPLRRAFRISVPDTSSSINITNLMNPPITYTYTNQFSTAPLHVNAASVTCWSTNGETTMLDSAAPDRSFATGNVIAIEAFGSASDPAANLPTATMRIKLGSTTLVSMSQILNNSNWHLRALVTIRSAGVTGTATGNETLILDSTSPTESGVQTATIDTTPSLNVSVTGEITDFTGMESITCDQLTISDR